MLRYNMIKEDNEYKFTDLITEEMYQKEVIQYINRYKSYLTKLQP